MHISKSFFTFFILLLATASPYSYSNSKGGVSVAALTDRVFQAPAPDRPGHTRQYQRVKVGNRDYYYRDGLFFRLHTGRYITIDPPLGARVGFLPRSAIQLNIGPHRYFRLGLTWYLFHGDTDYEVVKDPREQKDELAEDQSSEYEQQKIDLAIYAAEGQSDDQLDRDRYECHLWANKQSGFDPTLPDQDLNQRDFYTRAMTACLEGRGYTVR